MKNQYSRKIFYYLTIIYFTYLFCGSSYCESPYQLTWTKTNNPSNADEYANSVAVDSTGIYVVGRDCSQGNFNWRIEKRNLINGSTIWTQLSTPSVADDDPKSIAVDATGIYVFGEDYAPGDVEWRIEKRDLTNGATIWTQVSNPSSSSEYAANVAVDATGIYLVGTSFASGNPQWRIEKRNLSDGATIWTQISSPNLFNIVNSVAVDASGIYVVGYDAATSSAEWRIEKRSLANGATIWTQTSNPGSISIPLNSVAVDATGIYVVGYDNSPGNSQWQIEKRNLADGSGIWRQTSNPSNLIDRANSVALDATGIYVVGYDNSPGNSQWRIEKRSLTDGTIIWTQTNNPSSENDHSSLSDDDHINSVAVDSTGIYVVGRDESPDGGEWRIEKYGPDTTPPSVPSVVCDGAVAGTDASSTYSTTTLSANWTAATDTETGISGYQYAIGTTAGGTNTLSWATIGDVLTVTKTGLMLTAGTTYYFSVKATNGQGLTGNARNSNGQYVVTIATSDIIPPGKITTLIVTTGQQKIYLTWLTPGDDGYSGEIVNGRFEIACSSFSTCDPAEDPTYAIRLLISSSVPNSVRNYTWNYLPPETTYYIWIRTSDTLFSDNWSVWSDSVSIFVSISSSADTTPPSDIYEVRDGTGTDINVKIIILYVDGGYSWSAQGDLSANWNASSDTESGIAKYWYAISSTTVGGTDFVNWTDNGISTSVTKVGLSLIEGNTYYFTVKAENGIGLQNTPANSNGQFIVIISTGFMPPSPINQVRDGTGTDISYTYLTSQLSANWDEAIDPETGISKYWYAIGTTPGNTNVINWSSATVTNVTKTGLSLTVGTTYYFTVKAENGIGLQSNASNSNGQFVAIYICIDPGPQVYPNPFNLSQNQSISFTIGGKGEGEFKVYTLGGKLVKKITTTFPVGAIEWDGRNEDGEKVARGIYLYNIKNEYGSKTGKIAVIYKVKEY